MQWIMKHLKKFIFTYTDHSFIAVHTVDDEYCKQGSREGPGYCFDCVPSGWRDYVRARLWEGEITGGQDAGKALD